MFRLIMVRFVIWGIALHAAISAFAINAQPIQVLCEELLPFQYLENGKLKGPVADQVRAILKAADINAEIKVMPWARLYKQAMQKPNVLAFSMIKTERRSPHFHWLTEVAQLNRSLLSLERSPVQSLGQLRVSPSDTLVVIRNSYVHTFLNSKGFTRENGLYLVPTFDDQVRLFGTDKIQYLIHDPAVITAKLVQQGYEASELTEIQSFPELQSALYLVASYDTEPQYLERLKLAINKSLPN